MSRGKWSQANIRLAVSRICAGPRVKRYAMSWHEAVSIVDDVVDELLSLRNEGIAVCNMCNEVVSNIETHPCVEYDLVSFNYTKIQDMEWQISYLIHRNEVLETAVRAFSEFPASTG